MRAEGWREKEDGVSETQLGTDRQTDRQTDRLTERDTDTDTWFIVKATDPYANAGGGGEGE